MSELSFNTQAQILDYLGKRNDRNLIKRMIKRGELYVEDGMYYLVGKKENKSESKQSEIVIKEIVKEDSRIKEELEKYKGWLDEANQAYEDLEKEMDSEIQNIINRCYNHMLKCKCLPTQTKLEFNYWVKGQEYKDIQFSPEDVREADRGTEEIEYPF